MREEEKLDVLLTKEAGDLPPPPEVERAITPWRLAMGQIVWGIGLTTCTLNIWIVQSLMVAVGVVLLWLGFRILRRENRWFTVCWGISVLEVVLRFLGFVLNATIWGGENPSYRLIYLVLLLPLIQYVCLWKAIKEVRRRAGQPTKAGAAAALIWFYLILAALALINVQGLLVIGLLLVAYILILRSLAKLPHLLDEVGYQVTSAPVKISDRSIWIAWVAALLVCIPTATLLFGRYPMEWTLRPKGEQVGLEEIRAHLVELGMPEQVADDLSAEDLSGMEGALQVEVETDETWFHMEKTGDDLHIANLAIELPGKRWKIIHHFQWQGQPKYRTTECIVISTADPSGYQMQGALSGRLLYDKDGTTYLGAYYQLSLENVRPTALRMAVGEWDTWPMALFSLPLNGENCRGYLLYEVQTLVDGYLLDSYINYTHQISLWNYPLTTAQQHNGQGSVGKQDRFQTLWSAIQFFPDSISKETEEDPV